MTDRNYSHTARAFLSSPVTKILFLAYGRFLASKITPNYLRAENLEIEIPANGHLIVPTQRRGQTKPLK